MSRFWALDLEVFEAGESPVWDDRHQVFYWVDHAARQLHRWDIRYNLRRRWQWQEVPACCGLSQDGGVIVADNTGLWRIADLDSPPKRFVDFSLPDHHRPNDGKSGPDGAFWVTIMDENPERAATGYLMRIAPDCQITTHVKDLRTGNGLEWSPDGRQMYLSDSRGLWIDRFSFDAKRGRLDHRRRFFTTTGHTGRPDGAAVDAEGCYWFAGIGAGKLNRVSPRGKLLFSLPLPMANPTMPCFGAADLATVFVTTQKSGIYHTEFSVKGLPARRFAG